MSPPTDRSRPGEGGSKVNYLGGEPNHDDSNRSTRRDGAPDRERIRRLRSLSTAISQDALQTAEQMLAAGWPVESVCEAIGVGYLEWISGHVTDAVWDGLARFVSEHGRAA